MISIQQMPTWRTDDELFPQSWLLSEPILNRINRSVTGVGLFQVVRWEAAESKPTDFPHSPIIDFQYSMINPVLQAIARVTWDDLASLPLSALIPEGVKTTLISRMAQVVETGHPQHYNDVFKLDGVVTQHDQVCLKAGDGVLVLVMDVTYVPLSNEEHQRRTELMETIRSNAPIDVVRNRLMAVIA